MRILLTCAALILVGCTSRDTTPVTPQALEIGTPFTVFAATNRAQDPDGSYGYHRADQVDLLELTVSVPPDRMPGQLNIAYARPQPRTQFTLAGRKRFDGPDPFLTRVRAEMARQNTDEVVLFVHGYNTTQTETAFRSAQLAMDIGVPAVQMIYSWPSRGKVLGYAYDAESMLYSRDGLEQLLRQLRGAGVSRITLTGHSMGSFLIMETLRQIEAKDPGWTARSLSSVVLISPDLDVDLFRNQMQALAKVPEPFLILVSGRDPALRASAILRGERGRDRLGKLQMIDSIADLPVQVIDTTAFSKGAESRHFVIGSSPALLSILNDAQQMVDVFGTEDIILDNILPGDVIQTEAATQIRLEQIAESPR